MTIDDPQSPYTVARSFNEYQKYVAWVSNKYPTVEKAAMVYGLGLTGESQELIAVADVRNVEPEMFMKELGDVMWYVAAIVNAHSWMMNWVTAIDDVVLFSKTYYHIYDNLAFRIATEAGKVAEMLKKVYGHGHPLAPKENLIKGHLFNIIVNANSFFLYNPKNAPEWSLYECLRMNVAKLMERYPNGFESERSINKKDD